MIAFDSFDLGILIHETIEYIKPILLEEEALAIDYILINNEENMLYYAKFAMPVLLMENTKHQIVRLKSNNPPLSKWQPTFNTDSFDISNITKFLIYSDGIVENETIFDQQPYADFIEKDFLNSFTREDFKNSFYKKIEVQDDDITLVYIHRLSCLTTLVSKETFASTLNDVDKADEWYCDVWKNINTDIETSNSASLVFSELFMNAYEHGSLGITSQTKHYLLENDNYIEALEQKEKECIKKVSVKVEKMEHNSQSYIITKITDEGDGFDTQILSEIFRNREKFNGRGVFISRKNSLGIYYNNEGNSVLFLHKV